MHQEALLKAIRIAGNQASLAKAIKICRKRLNKWLNRDKGIPYEYVLAIENVTQGQVSRYELAPQLSVKQHKLSESSIFDRVAELETRLNELEKKNRESP